MQSISISHKRLLPEALRHSAFTRRQHMRTRHANIMKIATSVISLVCIFMMADQLKQTSASKLKANIDDLSQSLSSSTGIGGGSSSNFLGESADGINRWFNRWLQQLQEQLQQLALVKQLQQLFQQQSRGSGLSSIFSGQQQQQQQQLQQGIASVAKELKGGP